MRCAVLPAPSPLAAVPWAEVVVIGISTIIAAITGRRLAEHHDRCPEDACRENAALTKQLDAAQQQIADMGAELATGRANLVGARAALAQETERAERFGRQYLAEKTENGRLIAELKSAPGPVGPPVSTGTDREALHALTNQLALLEGRRAEGAPLADLSTIRAALADAGSVDGLQAAARVEMFLRGER
jgi:hypothetical protein